MDKETKAEFAKLGGAIEELARSAANGFAEIRAELARLDEKTDAAIADDTFHVAAIARRFDGLDSEVGKTRDAIDNLADAVKARDPILRSHGERLERIETDLFGK
jgi:hypothetical protein